MQEAPCRRVPESERSHLEQRGSPRRCGKGRNSLATPQSNGLLRGVERDWDSPVAPGTNRAEARVRIENYSSFPFASQMG